MSAPRAITILGGGPAGLAVGLAARRAGLPFSIYEAQERVGGNCITLSDGDFRFDSGAHRFHDKDPESTRQVQELLGNELQRIDAPSQIWHEGRYFDFPIAPFNLIKTLGLGETVRAAGSFVKGRLTSVGSRSFGDYARRNYGADLASRFLLNYSEKLWGAPSDLLSTAVCGKRLSGLGLRSLMIEAILGRRANTRHLDGAFYYPRQGFGTIVERMAEACGSKSIHVNSPVLHITHADDRIEAVHFARGHRVPVDEVVSSLPLGLMLQLMHPAPPASILDAARQLRFRNVVLVALFLNKEQITPNGSVYFPDPSVPFTRVYEPRNRSAEMAPPGKTSLVAELPCQPGDAVWNAGDSDLRALVAEQFRSIGWIGARDIIGGAIHRIRHAYPILELGYEDRLLPIMGYLGRFHNLRLAGRNGCFVYSHLHDMLRSGREIIEDYSQLRTVAIRPAADRSIAALRRAA